MLTAKPRVTSQLQLSSVHMMIDEAVKYHLGRDGFECLARASRGRSEGQHPRAADFWGKHQTMAQNFTHWPENQKTLNSETLTFSVPAFTLR